MKIDWSSISPDLFEQMVGLLLRAMGYENVTVRTGGSDAGWDLDAVLCRTLPDGTLDQELWRVECKRRSYKPASDEILNHYQAMSRQEDPGVGPADHLLFVTCASFANITKKKIEGYAKKDGLRVHFWEQRKLEELVSQHSRNSGLAQILAPFVEIDLSFDVAAGLVGPDVAARARDISLKLYRRGAALAAEQGIIIADTKFEFGLENDRMVLGDEALTPDSSRFWPADRYEPGRGQASYDKQFVRDYLESIGWDKKPPVPELPEEIVAGARAKYMEIFEILTGSSIR